jgi:hypothetical protein
MRRAGRTGLERMKYIPGKHMRQAKGIVYIVPWLSGLLEPMSPDKC